MWHCATCGTENNPIDYWCIVPSCFNAYGVMSSQLDREQQLLDIVSRNLHTPAEYDELAELEIRRR